VKKFLSDRATKMAAEREAQEAGLTAQAGATSEIAGEEPKA
jgi:hypothetical protein